MRKININRIAADDDAKEILTVFEKSLNLPVEKRTMIESEGIRLLKEGDRPEIKNQLFGKRD